MEKEITVTYHARKRLKERLGIRKSACVRHAQLVFDKGTPRQEVSGNLRRYMNKKHLQDPSINEMRLYGEFIYMFCDESLVTVFGVPKILNKKKPKPKGQDDEI